MNVAESIRKSIEKIPKSQPFQYSDLDIDASNFMTAAKALERLQKKGSIKKISKGVFYIPEDTVFGELGPDDDAMLNKFLFKDGKRVAYLTGVSLYNRLGLTTQMAFKIKIASKNKRFSLNQGALNVSSVKSYVDVTDDNNKLLGYLDALKDVNIIPDCSTKQALKRMTALISDLTIQEQIDLVQLAVQYPARAKALLGAILENLKIDIDLRELKNSLNPLTTIKLAIKLTDLPTLKNWNII